MNEGQLDQVKAIDEKEIYQRILATANEGIWVFDHNLNTTYVNLKMTAHFRNWKILEILLAKFAKEVVFFLLTRSPVFGRVVHYVFHILAECPVEGDVWKGH